MTKNKLQSLRIRIGKIVPEYAWLPLIFELTLNMLVYSGSRIFTAHWRHYNIESAPGSEHSARAMDDYHLFWMLSFLGGQLCALRSPGSEKCMAVFERRLSGEAGLSGLLFNTAYDEVRDRKSPEALYGML